MTVVADGAGAVCGSNGKSKCQRSDVSITNYQRRHAKGNGDAAGRQLLARRSGLSVTFSLMTRTGAATASAKATLGSFLQARNMQFRGLTTELP